MTGGVWIPTNWMRQEQIFQQAKQLESHPGSCVPNRNSRRTSEQTSSSLQVGRKVHIALCLDFELGFAHPKLTLDALKLRLQLLRGLQLISTSLDLVDELM